MKTVSLLTAALMAGLSDETLRVKLSAEEYARYEALQHQPVLLTVASQAEFPTGVEMPAPAHVYTRPKLRDTRSPYTLWRRRMAAKRARRARRINRP